MFQRYFQHLSLAKRTALLATTLCLGISLMLVAVSDISSRYAMREQHKIYGQSLATQLAWRASDALINNDRVSLQAILTQYVKDTPVDMGTIYDVTREPIAKAGNADSPNARNYSSAIGFENSVAGYAVISQQPTTLNTGREGVLISLLILSGLATLFTYSVISRAGQALVDRLNKITFVLRSKKTALQQEPSRWQDEIEKLRREVELLPLEQLTTHNSSSKESCEAQNGSLLYIRFENLLLYRKQLGATALKDYTQLMQNALNAVAKLYDAKIKNCRECTAIMTFEDNHSSSSLCFRAASCAWLLRAVFAELEARYHLKLGTSMACAETSAVFSDAFNLYSALETEDQISKLSGYCEQLKHRILLTGSCVDDCGEGLTTTQTEIENIYELTEFTSFENSSLKHQQSILVKQLA